MIHRTVKMFFGACDIYNPMPSVSKWYVDFKKEFQNVGKTSVRWESRSVTTQPRENDDRKFEVIVFVASAGMTVILNNCYI